MSNDHATSLTSILCGNVASIDHVYGEGRQQRIASLTRLHPTVVTAGNLDAQLPDLAEVEAIFATWGMPALTAEHLDRLPRLRAVFYAAGSVQRFAAPLLARDVAVYSAWQCNAVYVARMTLALVLLGCKGFLRNARDRHRGVSRVDAFRGHGMFDATVAILGAGAIGRQVIALLRPLGFNVIVFDPFLADEAAAQLGVRKVTLEQAFGEALIVSNHLADKPQTAGMLTGPHFAAMPDKAVFINTARDRTVRHDELLDVLHRRPDLTAVLDVIEGQDDATTAELLSRDNVFVTTHIAGAMARERLTLGDAAIEQFEKWHAGAEAPGRVTSAMLAAMA